MTRADRDHGDIHAAYEKMGSPAYPTRKQIQELQHAAELGAPEKMRFDRGELNVTLPQHGLAVIEIK